MSEKVQKILTRLGNIWPKRIDDDGLGEWLADWENALKRFDGWVIDAAATRLIQSRTKPGFPVPREMIDACNDVEREDRAGKPGLRVTHDQQLGDPYALADALVRCDLGRQAANAEPCWLLALHDFCRTNRRLPTGQEIARCKQVAVDFDERYRDCVTGRAGDFSKPLARLAETMIKRREAMRARLLGREAA